jgi:hypothetical protein
MSTFGIAFVVFVALVIPLFFVVVLLIGRRNKRKDDDG